MKRPARLLLGALVAAALCTAATSAFAADPLRLMPEAASANARRVDDLTYLILWVTLFTFVGVQFTLLAFLFKFRSKPGVRAKHTHGNHTVEMVWTVVPAAILVFLAVYQMGLWAEMKASKPGDATDAVDVQIFAKQFEWNFRYPGADGKYGTADDLTTVKALVVPVNRPVTAEVRAMDVIHSFYLPAMRFKQDAVPGLHTRIWFQPDKLSVDRLAVRDSKGEDVKEDFFDIVCAELCGNLHTSMNAKLYVVTDEQYAAWQKGEAVRLSERTTLPAATPGGDLSFPYDFIWQAWSLQDDLRVKGPPPWHRNPFEGDFTGGEGDGESSETGESGETAPETGASTVYEEAQGTAVLKGVVRYKGTRPAPAFQNTSSEPRCEAHGQVVKETKEVNEDLTLPNAFVYVVKGPALGLSGYPDPKVVVDQIGCSYHPHVVGAMAKSPITFKNTDQFNHNVKIQGPGLSWNKTQSAGASDPWTPGSRAMGARITCDVHTWMAAYLHVLDHPFFSTSSREGGTFEIKGLYPGKYTLKVWHETWAKDKGGMEVEVELKEGENSIEVEVQGDQ